MAPGQSEGQNVLAHLFPLPKKYMGLMVLLSMIVLSLALTLSPALMADDCPVLCDCHSTDAGILINCSERNLTAIPSIPAHLREQVVELDVSHNSLRRLTKLNLPQLRWLSLADNELDALPAFWLHRLTALRHLDLSGNGRLTLRELSKDVLTFARNLRELNLSRCEAIDTLDGAEAALNSPTLEVLDLSHCSLSEVSGKLLTGLPALRRLDLSFNPLHLLYGLNSSTLQELSLVRTGLESIHPAALQNLHALTELDVSGNERFAFPETCILSPSLTVLRAHSCRLQLHNLRSFPNLRYATLQHNNIRVVWNTSFYNVFLTELDLSNNKIQDIQTDALQTLPRLKLISLTNNKLSSIDPYVFANNEFLVQVNLSRNPLRELGNMHVPRLETLDVSHCNVEKLSSDGLIGMPALRSLDLSFNWLEYVPDNLTSDSLQWLDLRFCKLSNVSNDTFRGLPALAELDLSGNRFTEPFSALAFASNAHLRGLRLRDNPWHCDCTSQSFRRFTTYTLAMDQQGDSARIRCASPQHVQGQSLLHACADQRTLDERKSLGVWLIIGVVILPVGVIIGVGIYKYLQNFSRGKQFRPATERPHSSHANIVSSSGGGGASSNAASGNAAIRHSAPNAGEIPEEQLSAIAEAMADPSAPGPASGGATLAAANTLTITAPSSMTSSAVSSPARTPRPRSGCSSDASGEDSDDQTDFSPLTAGAINLQ